MDTLEEATTVAGIIRDKLGRSELRKALKSSEDGWISPSSPG
jgi:hypothetical protein